MAFMDIISSLELYLSCSLILVLIVLFCIFFFCHVFSIINDSGLYAMKNLEHFEVNLDMMEKYSEEDIGHLCIKLVNDMVFNDHNCAILGKSKIMEVVLFPKFFCVLFHDAFEFDSCFFLFVFLRSMAT
jgi:hypothetical protein